VQFDNPAAAEIRPEIEAGVEEEHHRKGAQNRRSNDAGETTAHNRSDLFTPKKVPLNRFSFSKISGLRK